MKIWGREVVFQKVPVFSSLGCGIGYGYLHRIPTRPFEEGKKISFPGNTPSDPVSPLKDGFTEVSLNQLHRFQLKPHCVLFNFSSHCHLGMTDFSYIQTHCESCKTCKVDRTQCCSLELLSRLDDCDRFDGSIVSLPPSCFSLLTPSGPTFSSDPSSYCVHDPHRHRKFIVWSVYKHSPTHYSQRAANRFEIIPHNINIGFLNIKNCIHI